MPGHGSFNANATTVGFQFNDPFLVGAAPVNDSATIRFPDIVWNWRIDQAWGAALIGGAVHGRRMPGGAGLSSRLKHLDRQHSPLVIPPTSSAGSSPPACG